MGFKAIRDGGTLSEKGFRQWILVLIIFTVALLIIIWRTS